MRNVSEPKIYSQFIRHVMPSYLEDGTMDIPQAFTEKHESLWSKYACLEVSSGKLWKVELKICDGRVWLHKGWKVFVDDCSIQCGYTLVFRYEGGSFFHVSVFGTSGMEIEYPDDRRVNPDHFKSTKIKEEVADVDSSVEILIDWAPETKNNSEAEADEEVLQENRVAGSSTREGIMQQARAFQSSNPHFVAIIKPDYGLFLESDAGSIFNGRDDNVIYLSGPDTRAWHMTYSVGESPAYQLTFISGWDEFVQHYDLCDGDPCVLELINRTVLIFDVILFQTPDKEGQGQEEGDVQTAEEGQVEVAETLESNKPSFTVVYKLTSQSLNRIKLPEDHAEVYLVKQHNKQAFLHGVGGQVWPVKLYHSRSIGRFTTGWKDFVVDNHLEDGDKCVFELQSQVPNHYNVTLIRAAESAMPPN